LENIFIQIILQVVLIALNAVFACAEIAVISLNENKLEKVKDKSPKKYKVLSNFIKEPARFLATIQVAITLSGFLGSAFAADNFSDRLVGWLIDIGVNIPEKTLDALSVIIITIILSYFTLIFGELVPKRLAMKNAEKLALGMAGMLNFVSKFFSPVVYILTVSTNGILRLLGIDPNSDDNEVSEEEIRMMVDMGSKKGVIDTDEKDFIQNVFEFDDLTIGEFATHRTDICILWADESLKKWEEKMHKSRHTLYPVCGDTVDNVLGTLNIKDYFALENKTMENVMKKVLRPAHFVPDSVKADVLFKQMKTTHNHFAVVLDEYGGMVGIVTMSDLLEQLVGDLENNDDEEDTFKKTSPKTWEIGGGVSLDEVAKQLEVKLPLDEYDTFGGFVFGEYGVIPADGSTFEIEAYNLKIKVVKIKGHRLKKAVVKVIKAEE
jgi:putative hemolysin